MELGLPEMILIGIVLVVFFGPKKLPELGASFGKAIRDFKRTLSETTSDLRDHIEVTEHRPVGGSSQTPPVTGEASKAADSEHIESTKSLSSISGDRSS
jgi:sec-independent protein translocase protein TatA